MHRLILELTAEPAQERTNIPAIFALLKLHGANFNAANADGDTPLHVAIAPIGQNMNLIRMLRQHGACMNVFNKKGATPLGQARQYEYYRPFMKELRAQQELT